MRLVRLTLLSLLCAAPAAAQEPAVQPTEPEAPADAAQPDPAVEGGTQSQEVAASPEVLDKARGHFKQGVAFADTGDCGGAIVEFEAAYKLIPRPNALYNIAQCQERLFRYDLAIQYYERYLQEAPADAPDRSAVEAALKTLGNLLGILHIQSNVPAEVWIDDRLAGEAPGDVYVPAGGHSLELRAEGYIPSRTEVRLVGREEVDLSLKLIKARTTVKVTETTGLDPTLFWVGVGATVVAAGVGGMLAVRVGSLHSEAELLPGVDPQREQARKDIEGAELLADIFFGGAAVLAVGTTIVAFLTEWEAPQSGPAEATDETALRLRPAAAPGYAGFELRGAL